MHLTASQRQGVTHASGPLLLIAGAGTGKTRVLAERIGWLMRERRVVPHNILALTFTEKAAAELQERVDATAPLSAFSPWIGTFHGFCEMVLRAEAVRIGLDPHFRILTAPEAWVLLKRHLFTLPLQHYRPLGNPTKYMRALIGLFGQAKEQEILPDALEVFANGPQNAASPHWHELAAVYRIYVDLQRREGVMDFGDLILETLRLFREQPDVRVKYQERYPEILVDEFQDTNATQGALLELLTKPDSSLPAHQASGGRSLVVASDDDQAIYAFRGSNVENVLRFRDRFPQSGLVVLTENFRSPQQLLDHAYRLIQQNNPHRLEATTGISKRLVSRTGNSNLETGIPIVEHRHFATEEAELSWVAEEILRLTGAGHVTYRDLAILVRTNAQATDVAPSLIRRDIPHVTTEARGLLARPEVKDALAYFRLLADPGDGRALFRLMTHPALGILDTDRTRLLAALREHRGPILPLLQDAERRAGLGATSRPGIERLASLLAHHVRHARTLRPSQVYLEFLERSGVLKAAVQESERHPEILPNLQAFLAYIRSLERGLDAGDFLEFFDVLDAAVEGGEGPAAATLSTDTDAVRLLTVHAAKGLEFGVVFLVGATADRFPSRGRHRPLELPVVQRLGSTGPAVDDRATHVLEERRLFYVALTRAQQRFVVTSATTAAGARLRRKPSPFIAEAGIVSLTVEASPLPTTQLALPFVATPTPLPSADAARAISASKIATYELCPLKYRYQYILRIPTPPHHTLSFGTTLHEVLRDLALAAQGERKPTMEDALHFYERRWISDGYESAAHEAARKDAGRASLTAYLTARPDLLNRAPFAVESPFSLPLPTTRLTGRIDRIDRLDDGRVVVTDFKTGEGKLKDAGTDIQLSIYALALRRAFDLEPASLRLSYIETGRDDETTRPVSADEETARHVERIATQIRAGSFPARPGFICRFCDFRHICDDADLS